MLHEFSDFKSKFYFLVNRIQICELQAEIVSLIFSLNYYHVSYRPTHFPPCPDDVLPEKEILLQV